MSEALKNIDIDELSILSLQVNENNLIAEISDGRTVSIPVAWFPRLVSAPIEDLKDFELSPSGYGIHWPKLDEDISVRAFVG